MSKRHFRNLSLGVVRLLAIENRFGHGRTVQDEAYGTLALLQRERLKRENVDALFGEGLAELAKRSRSVFQTDCELLSGGHGRNLLAVYLEDGLERSCEIQLCLESYSGDAPASRAKRNRFTVCHTQLPATGDSSPARKSEAYRLTNMQDIFPLSSRGGGFSLDYPLYRTR